MKKMENELNWTDMRGRGIGRGRGNSSGMKWKDIGRACFEVKNQD